MNRIRVYNEKGAKFTTVPSEAKFQNFVPVEAVTLLHRRRTWNNKITLCDPSHSVTANYYKEKLGICENRLDELREEGYYVPVDHEDLPIAITEKI